MFQQLGAWHSFFLILLPDNENDRVEFRLLNDAKRLA